MTQEYGFSTEGNTIVADFKDQVQDRVFLITGPSQGGIGAETAISLARHGSPSVIILLGRSIAKIQPTIDTIRSVSPSTAIKFIPISLDSLSSVRAAAKQILADSEIKNIDVIINNAAIMACPFQKTIDGYESQFATNHLGHFLLTNLLMPKLKISKNPRVVNLSSWGHCMSDVHFDDFNFNSGKDYDVWKAYGQSKTANILFSVELNRRGMKSFAAHPGSIASGLQQYINEQDRENAFKTLLAAGQDMPTTGRKNFQQGCSTTLRAALDPSLQIVVANGKESCYLVDCQIETGKTVAPYALDKAHARKLWEMSEDIVGEKFDW